MMDLTDIPVIGTVASVGAVVGDLVFYGGELFVSLVVYAILEPSTWLSIVLYLQQLAARVSWLPEGALGDVVTLALVFIVAVSIARFVRNWWVNRGGAS